MIYRFYTIHVMVCLFLILVVLLQQGKGADLSVFGGGGTMTAFGARGAATVLHKLTVFSFVAFIFTTLAIGVAQKARVGSTVMSGVEAVEPVAEDEPAENVPAVGALPEADDEQLSTEQDSTAGEGSSAISDQDPTGDNSPVEAEESGN